jgi:hypothetical protein
VEPVPHAGILAIIVLAFENEFFFGVGKKTPRFVDGKFATACCSEKIPLGVTIHFSVKGPYGGSGYGKSFIGDDAAVVHLDYATEASTSRTSSDGGVEGEGRRRSRGETGTVHRRAKALVTRTNKLAVVIQ